MAQFFVPIDVAIEARDREDAFRQASSVQALVKNPFVRGQLENEGVQVKKITVFMPQEKPRV